MDATANRTTGAGDGSTRREWKAQILWVLAAGALGFAEAGLFSSVLRLPRPLFLVPYVAITGAFVFAYAR